MRSGLTSRSKFKCNRVLPLNLREFKFQPALEKQRKTEKINEAAGLDSSDTYLALTFFKRALVRCMSPFSGFVETVEKERERERKKNDFRARQRGSRTKTHGPLVGQRKRPDRLRCYTATHANSKGETIEAVTATLPLRK